MVTSTPIIRNWYPQTLHAYRESPPRFASSSNFLFTDLSSYCFNRWSINLGTTHKTNYRSGRQSRTYQCRCCLLSVYVSCRDPTGPVEPLTGRQGSQSTYWHLVGDTTELQNHLAQHPTLPSIRSMQLLSHYPPFQKFISETKSTSSSTKSNHISKKKLSAWFTTSSLSFSNLQKERTLSRASKCCLDHLSKISIANEYFPLSSWLQALAKFNTDLTVVLQTDNEQRFLRCFVATPIANSEYFGTLTMPVFVGDCFHYKNDHYDGVCFVLVTKSSYGDTIPLAWAIIPREKSTELSWVIQLCIKHRMRVDKNAFFTDQGPLIATFEAFHQQFGVSFRVSLCLQHLIRSVRQKHGKLFGNYRLGKSNQEHNEWVRECHRTLTRHVIALSDCTSGNSFFANLLALFSALIALNKVGAPGRCQCCGVILYLLRYDPKLWTVLGNSDSFNADDFLANVKTVVGHFSFLQKLYVDFHKTSVIDRSNVVMLLRNAADFSHTYEYTKKAPLFPGERTHRMGFKRTNLAETIAGQLLAMEVRHQPPHKTNLAFVTMYNKAVSKFLSKLRKGETLSSIGQQIREFNSVEYQKVGYEVVLGNTIIVSNHDGFDGVTALIRQRQDQTTHQLILKWKHTSETQSRDTLQAECEGNILSARDEFCFSASCTRHVEFTQMRQCICPCFPVIFDEAKKHPNWPFSINIPLTGLVEGLFYHKCGLSITSRQLLAKKAVSDPFSGRSNCLVIREPTSQEINNLRSPTFINRAPRYTQSSVAKSKRFTSNGELTCSPNRPRKRSKREGGVNSPLSIINKPNIPRKQHQIDAVHVEHKDSLGHLNTEGIKQMDRIHKKNFRRKTPTTVAPENYCPLSNISAGDYSIYQISRLAQLHPYSPNPELLPASDFPILINTNTKAWENMALKTTFETSHSNKKNDDICPDDDYGDGDTLIHRLDALSLEFSLHDISVRYAQELLGNVNIDHLNVNFGDVLQNCNQSDILNDGDFDTDINEHTELTQLPALDPLFEELDLLHSPPRPLSYNDIPSQESDNMCPETTEAEIRDIITKYSDELSSPAYNSIRRPNVSSTVITPSIPTPKFVGIHPRVPISHPKLATLWNRFSIGRDYKAIKVEVIELRAVLFALDVRFKSKANKTSLSLLLKKAMHKSMYFMVKSRANNHKMRAKRSIDEDPTQVLASIWGTISPKDSPYVSKYGKDLSNLDNQSTRHASTQAHRNIHINSIHSMCVSGDQCFFGNMTLWTIDPKTKCRNCSYYYHGGMGQCCSDSHGYCFKCVGDGVHENVPNYRCIGCQKMYAPQTFGLHVSINNYCPNCTPTASTDTVINENATIKSTEERVMNTNEDDESSYRSPPPSENDSLDGDVNRPVRLRTNDNITYYLGNEETQKASQGTILGIIDSEITIQKKGENTTFVVRKNDIMKFMIISPDTIGHYCWIFDCELVLTKKKLSGAKNVIHSGNSHFNGIMDFGRSITEMSDGFRKATDDFWSGSVDIERTKQNQIDRKNKWQLSNKMCEKIHSDYYVSDRISVDGFCVTQLPRHSNIVRFNSVPSDNGYLEPIFNLKSDEFFFGCDDYEHQHGNSCHGQFSVVVCEDDSGCKTLQVVETKSTDDVFLSLDLRLSTEVNSLLSKEGVTIAYYQSTGTDHQPCSISFFFPYQDLNSGKPHLKTKMEGDGLMRLYFECNSADLTKIVKIFSDWRMRKESTRPFELEFKSALCLRQFFNRSLLRYSNNSQDPQGHDTEVINCSAHTLGLPVCGRLIKEVAESSWTMLHGLLSLRDSQVLSRVDSFMYHRTRYNCRDQWRTFVYQEDSIANLEPNVWIKSYNVNLWVIMISVNEPKNVRVLFPQFYYGLEKGTNLENTYDLLYKQQRLFLIPICDNTHWTLALVYVYLSGNYSIITLDSMSTAACGNNTSVESNLSEFFGDKMGLGSTLVVNKRLNQFFDKIPGQLDTNSCGVFVCLYAFWIAKNANDLISIIEDRDVQPHYEDVFTSFRKYVKSVEPNTFRYEFQTFVTTLNNKIYLSGIAATTTEENKRRVMDGFAHRIANKKTTNHKKSLVKSQVTEQQLTKKTDPTSGVLKLAIHSESNIGHLIHDVPNNTLNMRNKLRPRKLKLPTNIQKSRVVTDICNGEEDGTTLRRSNRTKKKNEECIYLYTNK